MHIKRQLDKPNCQGQSTKHLERMTVALALTRVRFIIIIIFKLHKQTNTIKVQVTSYDPLV